MSQGLTPKQITVVNIITMLAGFLGAIVVLVEQDRFWGTGHQNSMVSNVLLIIFGIFCFFNLFRHIRIWRNLGKPDDKQNSEK